MKLEESVSQHGKHPSKIDCKVSLFFLFHKFLTAYISKYIQKSDDLVSFMVFIFYFFTTFVTRM